MLCSVFCCVRYLCGYSGEGEWKTWWLVVGLCVCGCVWLGFELGRVLL